MLDQRRYSVVEIARLWQVPPHMVTNDLPPGYWEDELRRSIARRSVAARLRRFWRRMVS